MGLVGNTLILILMSESERNENTYPANEEWRDSSKTSEPFKKM